MSMKINFIFLLGCMMIAFSSCSDDNLDFKAEKILVEASSSEQVVSNMANEMPMDNQLEANEVNQILLNNLVLDGKFIMRSNHNKKDYPSFWGGSYITPSGMLTILFKGDSLEVARRISTIKSSRLYRFERCKYSYQELQQVMEELDRHVDNAEVFIKDNICGYGILDAQNCVEVSLKHKDDNFIKKFKTIYNHPAITFVESGQLIEETDLNPGGYLTCSTDGSHGSFAFRAREKTGAKRNGMVTAGHVLSVNQKVYVAGKVIGTCSASQNSGSVDAAFVPIVDSAFEPSNFIVGTVNELSVATSLPGVGTFVNMRGSTTGSNGKGGYIKSTNYTFTSKGIKYTNMTTATYLSQAGDSGGIIYTYVKSSDTRYTVGIHLGTTTVSGVRVFTKADQALAALNVERY